MYERFWLWLLDGLRARLETDSMRLRDWLRYGIWLMLPLPK
ncbi:hypothetical protein MCACP_17930 [Neomoorella carbonis]